VVGCYLFESCYICIQENVTIMLHSQLYILPTHGLLCFDCNCVKFIAYTLFQNYSCAVMFVYIFSLVVLLLLLSSVYMFQNYSGWTPFVLYIALQFISNILIL